MEVLLSLHMSYGRPKTALSKLSAKDFSSISIASSRYISHNFTYVYPAIIRHGECWLLPVHQYITCFLKWVWFALLMSTLLRKWTVPFHDSSELPGFYANETSRNRCYSQHPVVHQHSCRHSAPAMNIYKYCMYWSDLWAPLIYSAPFWSLSVNLYS